MAELRRARAEAALDDVSDHLGVVLQRADELLAEWSAFGAGVRGQVEREAAAIGDAVAGAVEVAVARATAGSVERTLADQVGARLAALTAEIAKLEARTRAAARAVTVERGGDRRLLWAVIGGIVLANTLLVALWLRPPPAVSAPAPAAEPVKLAPAAAGPAPAAADLAPAAVATPELAGELAVDAPSSSEPPASSKGGSQPARPASGAGAGASTARGAAAQSGGANVAGGHGAAAGSAEHAGAEHAGSASGSGSRGAAAKLPPRAPAPRR